MTNPSPPVPPIADIANAWRPISKAQSQHPYLVCNAAFKGWHEVGILSAIGEWWAYNHGQTQLPYPPTHFMELPSVPHDPRVVHRPRGERLDA